MGVLPEESPGSAKTGCRVTPGESNLRESATENIPPSEALCIGWVRVKWCGKSAPRLQQCKWQGKPHPEQDQIGIAFNASSHSLFG